jgi:hypothetical protein
MKFGLFHKLIKIDNSGSPEVPVLPGDGAEIRITLRDAMTNEECAIGKAFSGNYIPVSGRDNLYTNENGMFLVYTKDGVFLTDTDDPTAWGTNDIPKLWPAEHNNEFYPIEFLISSDGTADWTCNDAMLNTYATDGVWSFATTFEMVNPPEHVGTAIVLEKTFEGDSEFEGKVYKSICIDLTTHKFMYYIRSSASGNVTALIKYIDETVGYGIYLPHTDSVPLYSNNLEQPWGTFTSMTEWSNGVIEVNFMAP